MAPKKHKTKTSADLQDQKTSPTSETKPVVGPKTPIVLAPWVEDLMKPLTSEEDEREAPNPEVQQAADMNTRTADTNTADTNTGDTNTGDTNTGDTNTGDTTTPHKTTPRPAEDAGVLDDQATPRASSGDKASQGTAGKKPFIPPIWMDRVLKEKERRKKKAEAREKTKLKGANGRHHRATDEDSDSDSGSNSDLDSGSPPKATENRKGAKSAHLRRPVKRGKEKGPPETIKRNDRTVLLHDTEPEMDPESTHCPEKGKKSKAGAKGKGKRALPEETASEEETPEYDPKRAKAKRGGDRPKTSKRSKPKRRDEGRHGKRNRSGSDSEVDTESDYRRTKKARKGESGDRHKKKTRRTKSSRYQKYDSDLSSSESDVESTSASEIKQKKKKPSKQRKVKPIPARSLDARMRRRQEGVYNPTGRILSRRFQQVVNRLRKHYLEKSHQDPDSYPMEDLDQYVLDEFNRAELFSVSKLDIKFLRHYLYDKGMEGVSNKDMMDEIYEHLKLDEDAIACRDRLDQKLSNLAGVPVSFKNMVLTDEPVDVVNRLEGYLRLVEGRGEEGREAVARLKRKLVEENLSWM